jgi:hypothetical protein
MEVEQDPTQGSPEQTADPTPDPGPTIDWESEDNPYLKRFTDYRSTVDPKVTRLSQYEQAVEDFKSGDPEEMSRAAAVLGISDYLEIEEPEPDYDEDDPDGRMQALAAKVERLEAERADERSAKEQEQQLAHVESVVEARLSKLDGLDEDDKELVLAQAIRMAPDSEGMPDIQAAYDALVARDQARISQHEEQWRAGKRRAPASIQPGKTAVEQRNIADMTDSDGQLTQEGLDWLAQKMDDRS